MTDKATALAEKLFSANPAYGALRAALVELVAPALREARQEALQEALGEMVGDTGDIGDTAYSRAICDCVSVVKDLMK